jgi:taurine dioxygenase
LFKATLAVLNIVMQTLNWSFGAQLDAQSLEPSQVIDLLKKHKVLVVQNASINTQQCLVDYAQKIGKLFPQVSYYKITPTTELDYYTGSDIGVDDLTSVTAPGLPKSIDLNDWHQDGASYTDKRMIGIATVKFSKSDGNELLGDTSFCNLKGIYDSLSDPIKNLLSQLEIEHTSTFYRNHHYYLSLAMQHALKSGNIKDVVAAIFKLKTHIPTPFVDKIVKNNDWLNFSPKDHPRLLNLSEAESDAIVNMLKQQLNNPAWIYQHRWRPDQIVIWDNRYVLHRKIDNAGINTTRKFWRVQIEV